jgi:hypothetical protein
MTDEDDPTIGCAANASATAGDVADVELEQPPVVAGCCHVRTLGEEGDFGIASLSQGLTRD